LQLNDANDDPIQEENDCYDEDDEESPPLRDEQGQNEED
jgi:hypothetical protein